MARLPLPKSAASSVFIDLEAAVDLSDTGSFVANELRILDQTKPYAEIHGLPGANFEQDGIYFKNDFTEAFPKDITPYIEEEPEPEDDTPHPINAIIEQQTAPLDSSSGETLETMSLKNMKLLVESYGEKWPGDRNSAMDLLRGKSEGQLNGLET